MKNSKLRMKIELLNQDAERYQDQVRQLASDHDCFDGPKIAELCNAINIILNQVKTLEECMSTKKNIRIELQVQKILNALVDNGIKI